MRTSKEYEQQLQYLTGALGDAQKARWLVRYTHRMEKLFMHGGPTDEEIAKEVADIRRIEKETERDRNRVALEKPPRQDDGNNRMLGIEWDSVPPTGDKK